MVENIFQKVDGMVLPLTVEPTKVKVFHLLGYDIADRANIIDDCGFVVAQVESEFVAEEIVNIINNHDKLIDMCKTQ